MLLLFFPTLTLFFSYKYHPVVRVSSSIVSLSVQSKRASYLPLIPINTLKWRVSHIDLCTIFFSSIPFYFPLFDPFQPSFFQYISTFLSSIPYYFGIVSFVFFVNFVFYYIFSTVVFITSFYYIIKIIPILLVFY